MANEQNLTPVQPGQVLNPNGRPKGVPNRKTILNFLLFQADIEEMEIFSNKPSWWHKVKPKTLYEMMVMARAIQAVKADDEGTRAFSALNKALGDVTSINDGEAIEVVHIFKPEKLSENALEDQAEILRKRAERTVEAEVVDDAMDSPSGPPILRTVNT